MSDPVSPPPGTVRVVGLSGSLRARSYTRFAVSAALRGAAERGAQTELIDLREYDLPFTHGKGSSDATETVLRLRRVVKQAHGVILGTPEYHGSFSGVLKNALDLMGFEEFEGKLIGLIGVSGGRLGALHALSGLRIVGRALHAWVLPDEVAIPEVWRVFDEDGTLKHGDYEQRLLNLGHQVARFTALHNSPEAREFLRLWETAPVNPGGGETVATGDE